MAPPIRYQRIPTLHEWKKDSSVRLARRSKDPVLKRIDSIIEAFGLVGDQGARAILGGDLFFALDFWLKNKRTGEKGREPAIQALYSYTAHTLANVYNVTINVLPRELELNYGRTMSDHGTKLDRDWQCADYLTRAEALKYAQRCHCTKGRPAQGMTLQTAKNPPGKPH